MAISEQQQKQLTQWLNGRSKNFACSVCGANNWIPGDIVMAPVFGPGGAMQIGGPAVPMVQLICGKCAHILLFAAVPIGLAK